MSRTRHHRDAVSPRRYRLKDWPPRLRTLCALWHLRVAIAELAGAVNQREAHRALEELSRSPAAAWIGNRIVDDGATLRQKCTRCGAEQELALPQGIRSPADVPPGFDERLFAWKRAFQLAHERCSEGADAS